MKKTDITSQIRLKADLVPYTEEYSSVVRSWLDSEETYYDVCKGTQFPPPEDVVYGWQRNNVVSMIMLSESKPIAYGELWARPAELAVELSHLLVDPVRRSEGFGTSLVEQLFQRAAQRPGVAKVLVNLYSDSEHALGCYLKSGFQLMGTTKHLPGLRMIRLAK